MSYFHGPLWDTLLQVLRDPIFALVFSIILTILANRVVRKVIKIILYLSALAVFIWLLTHNGAFADICIAIVHAVFSILFVLIIVLACIAAIAILCVFIMFVISKPSPYRLRKLSSPWNVLSSLQRTEATSSREQQEALVALATGHVDIEQAKVLLHEKGQRVEALTQDFMSIFEALAEDFDEDHPFKIAMSLLHLYFSGLSGHMLLIKKIHRACNQEIMDLASMLPVIFPDADGELLEDIAGAKTFLPDKDEWQNLMDEMDTSLPYILLRLLCLRRDWKEVVTILYKGYCYVVLLDEYKETLYSLR